MGLEQLKVREIVKQAVSKNVDIPEFQRDFVWDPEQVKKLAESLYRDYPVGSFLLWDSAEYQESKTAQGTQASLWIVDGQQRTTALCLLMGQKPYWWSDAKSWNDAVERYDVFVNLFPEDNSERLEFALPNPIRRIDPRWISVRDVLRTEKVEDLTKLATSVATKLSNDPSTLMELFGQTHARIQRLWQIRERDIPIIKINHEVEDVAEIFARLNQEGTRVKEADVVLALAAVRNPSWVREQYVPFCHDLEDKGWDLDAGVFVRTMTGIGKGRARLIEVPKDFWEPQSLETVWRQASETVTEVLKRLAEFGIMSANLLPSTNSLIPLFVLHHRWRASTGYHFGKALHWFLLANRDGRYSGSAITSLNEDVRAIADAGDFAHAIASLKERLKVSASIDETEFLSRYDRAGSRFLRLMLYLLLFRREARDWVDKTRIGYDKTGAPVSAGFEPQWHHIFPRNKLKAIGVPDEEMHALANMTVLNERTNVSRLSGKQPSDYIKKFNITIEQLQSHLIPDTFLQTLDSDETLRSQWNGQRFTDFLIERAQLIAQEANRFLRELEQ